ncbi:MAG: DinB family protein [Saprospiraceae bacterium]|nr:DinB family protein [Saprospiraceae bacterium]
MDIPILQEKLTKQHDSFLSTLSGISEEAATLSKNNKWSPVQHLKHIYESVKIVRQLFGVPSFFLKMVWGLTNRKTRTYDELVNKYLVGLQSGGRASGRFLPGNISYSDGKKYTKLLHKEVEKLCRNLNKYPEKDLDLYILPHPLLGKLTLREMIYFTIYHVQHHENAVKNNL